MCLILVDTFRSTALQIGFVWFPYTFASVMRWRTWPVVLAASALPVLLALLLSL